MTVKIKTSGSVYRFFLNHAQKKGKYNTSKNLILNSSVIVSKHRYSTYFPTLIEDLFIKFTLPFDIAYTRNKYKSTHIPVLKSMNRDIVKVMKNIKKSKRLSFNLYFENEIYKLINGEGNIINTAKEYVKIFKDINYNSYTINKLFYKNINIKNIVLKESVVNIRRSFSMYYKGYLSTRSFEALNPINISKCLPTIKPNNDEKRIYKE